MASENLIITLGSAKKEGEDLKEAHEKIQRLQRTLYRQAKGKPKWKAWSLYGDLCKREVLILALKQVIENRGAPGIDGQGIELLRENAVERGKFLGQLQKELQEKTYKASPVKRVYIPKKNGKLRSLGIPTVKDRVVQTAVKMLLEPIFEADFHESSYGYRPNKNAHHAIDAICKGLIDRKTTVIDADLKQYFDSIPHKILLKMVRRRVSDGAMLKLIVAWLRAPIVEVERGSGKKNILPNKRGTPQGSVISPLLANIYLTDLDKGVNECNLKPKTIRYADDFVILCDNMKQGKELEARLRTFLKRYKLELNEEKTRVFKTWDDSLEFLGFRINWRRNRRTRKYYPHTEPSPKSTQKLREKIRAILNHWNLHYGIKDVVDKVNQIVQGWAGYFHYGNSNQVFSSTQWWLEKRFSRWLWRKLRRKKAAWQSAKCREVSKQYGLYQLPLKLNY